MCFLQHIDFPDINPCTPFWMLQIPIPWTRIMTVPLVELPRPSAADMMQQPFQPTVERGSIQEKYRIFMGYVHGNNT